MQRKNGRGEEMKSNDFEGVIAKIIINKTCLIKKYYNDDPHYKIGVITL